MSGWNRQTDRGGKREGGGRLMERERARGKEGGLMGVMEVNRKGWTARCMDITHMGLKRRRKGRKEEEEEEVSTLLHSPTKDADFLA